MKKLCFLFSVFVMVLNIGLANAAPSQVVIIRHADKWPDSPGNILNPTGYLRAVKFAEYYLSTFKEVPDFLFAAGVPNNTKSLRPIQTLTPLAGHREIIKKGVEINHTYTGGQEQQLVNAIMSGKEYDNKNLVICWPHQHIFKILTYFAGSKQNIVWPNTDYDTVYVLNFKDGKMVKSTRLDNQYPVPEIDTWDYFLSKK
jgi:hypothetical protein